MKESSTFGGCPKNRGALYCIEKGEICSFCCSSCFLWVWNIRLEKTTMQDRQNDAWRYQQRTVLVSQDPCKLQEKRHSKENTWPRKLFTNDRYTGQDQGPSISCKVALKDPSWRKMVKWQTAGSTQVTSSWKMAIVISGYWKILRAFWRTAIVSLWGLAAELAQPHFAFSLGHVLRDCTRSQNLRHWCQAKTMWEKTKQRMAFSDVVTATLGWGLLCLFAVLFPAFQQHATGFFASHWGKQAISSRHGSFSEIIHWAVVFNGEVLRGTITMIKSRVQLRSTSW